MENNICEDDNKRTRPIANTLNLYRPNTSVVFNSNLISIGTTD